MFARTLRPMLVSGPSRLTVVRPFSTTISTNFPDGGVGNDDYQTGKSGKRVKVKKRPTSYPRIYTKTGDGGRSSLFTGERRPKSDMVFEALGSTDELSSYLGLCREYAMEDSNNIHPYADHLQRIQCLLQDVGSCVATPKSSARQSHIEVSPQGLSKRHTQEIEEWIDEYSQLLPPLDNFILPGGGKTSAALHVARSVCRRAERRIAPLIENGDVDPEVLKYVNRLSDFLFTIARLAARLDSKDETIYTRPPPQDASGYVPLEGSTDIWKKTSKKDD